jgi:hypothetical protein
LLRTYWRPSVKIHGVETTVFDYAAMKRDAERPDSVFHRTLKALEGVDPTRLGEANAEKAFWLNAYNFAAIRLVVDHYPVDSIRSLKISLIRYPWSKEAIHIAGKEYSLREIEKSILLKRFDDPRIVFARGKPGGGPLFRSRLGAERYRAGRPPGGGDPLTT